MNLKDKKILVAYFSHKGQNYSNGKIVDLEKGNTEIAAEIIRDFAGADLFEIVPVHEYSHEYKVCVEEAKNELGVDSRPELAKNIDISGYDVIFVGYPNWCGTMPMPVWTFLEGQSFQDKIVLPFCTHEGSKMGRSESDLKKLADGADVRNGLAIHGSSVNEAAQDIQTWMNDAISEVS